MRKRYFFLVSLILAIGAVFISCTDFFSNSWAPWAARDPDKLVPTVTAGNVKELVEMAENNPDLSLAVLKKIRDAAKKARGVDKQKLRESAMEAAANAAGLGPAILGAADKLISIDSDEEARDLILDALDSMKNLTAATDLLESTLPKPGDPDFDDFVNAADPNDLAMAAALLIAGEAKKKSDPGEYINDFNSSGSLTDQEKLAIALAEAALNHQGELSGPLKDVLDGLNLL